QPLNAEMEALIQASAFDIFGKPRTTQYREFKALSRNPAATHSRLGSRSSPNLSSALSAEHSVTQRSASVLTAITTDQKRSADFPVRSNARIENSSRNDQAHSVSGSSGLESPRFAGIDSATAHSPEQLWLF